MLNVMKRWLKIVFPVIGALNGSIDPLPRFKKGTLRYVIMKMLHFFCYRCLPDVSKTLSLYNTYSKLDVEFEKRFQSVEDKFHKGIGHHLTKCFEAANLAALEDTCKKLQTSFKDLSTKINDLSTSSSNLQMEIESTSVSLNLVLQLRPHLALL